MFLNGVAMVGTIRVDKGRSCPLLVLMWICATFTVLVNGCLDPNDDRWIISFLCGRTGRTASIFANCCER